LPYSERPFCCIRIGSVEPYATEAAMGKHEKQHYEWTLSARPTRPERGAGCGAVPDGLISGAREQKGGGIW